MGLFDHHHRDDEQKEIEELEKIESDLQQLIRLSQRLSFIKIRFHGGTKMPEGPVTLNVGQKTVASIDGFDQNGAPFTGTIPTPSWTIDNSAIASIVADPTTPADEDVTGMSAGTAKLTAALTTAEGKALTDTEDVTVLTVSVLSSIKINFSKPV